MNIRKATQKDLEQIFSIYFADSLDRAKIDNSIYQTHIQKQGFLLGLENKNEYIKLINEAYLFLVAEENDQILGYIIADHRDKYIDDEYKMWFDLELKDHYYNSQNSMTISTIAVATNSSKKGIATMLLNDLEKHLRKDNYKYLFSIITLAPLTNCPSIIFHTKSGFKRIAMGTPRTLFDLKNYSGILMYKELN